MGTEKKERKQERNNYTAESNIETRKTRLSSTLEPATTCPGTDTALLAPEEAGPDVSSTEEGEGPM